MWQKMHHYHRSPCLSTVREADIIYVLKNGSIIEGGTKEELISHRGKYWEMYTGQTG